MRKHHILYVVAIVFMLSLVFIENDDRNNNVSALSYQSEVGIGFTINPTLSVSLSSNNLVISNLIPGSSSDSNSINISVATNASYGYTLSVNASSENLVHSNNTNTFSSIATDANLASLTADNTWGYSTSLDSGSTWSNYNGLSISDSIALINKDYNDSSDIDFKIATKASNTQPSGTYTGTINFTAVTKHIPVTLAEAYASEGKTMINGFYTMQDMTSTICSKVEAIGAQLQVLDKRDNKLYWISKLADNHCWMTQNLDLNLSHDRPLTSEDTDLNDSSLSGAYVEGYDYDIENGLIIFTPTRNTTNSGWTTSFNNPFSLDVGDINIDLSINDHGFVGNYYNWTAAIASNKSSSISSVTYSRPENNPKNSICPNNWRLPIISSPSTTQETKNDFSNLVLYYNEGRLDTTSNLRNPPVYFILAGRKSDISMGTYGAYWSSTTNGAGSSYAGTLSDSSISVNSSNGRNYGMSVRCLAR